MKAEMSQLRTIDRGMRGRARSAQYKFRSATLLAFLLVWGGAGCDSLLEVELPGFVADADLDDPALAEVLVRSAQTDFECFLGLYIFWSGVWIGELDLAGAGANNLLWSTRDSRRVAETAGYSACGIQSAGEQGGFHLQQQIARVQAEGVAARIANFTVAELPEKEFLLGKAFAYAGLNYVYAGEALCDNFYDQGTRQTPAQSFQTGLDRLSTALGHLSGNTSAEAVSLTNMAHVARARAFLGLGDVGNMMTEANLVPVDFVFNATYSKIESRRYNAIHARIGEGETYSVPPEWQNLEVGGMADPRVPVKDTGGFGSNLRTPLWLQLKYTERDSPIPIATWREVQLYIAEMQGGQTAVGIINMLRATHGLPDFVSTDDAEIDAQVIEENRRELWLQGNYIGLVLRNNLPLKTGINSAGHVYFDGRCIPSALLEGLGGNENAL